MDVCISCLFVCETGCSLIQRHHTVCVIVYDLEILTVRQPKPKLGCCTTEEKGGDGLCKNENNFYSFFCNSLKWFWTNLCKCCFSPHLATVKSLLIVANLIDDTNYVNSLHWIYPTHYMTERVHAKTDVWEHCDIFRYLGLLSSSFIHKKKIICPVQCHSSISYEQNFTLNQ
jgi:hypothetical protein